MSKITTFGVCQAAVDRSLQSGISELNGGRVLCCSQNEGSSGRQKLFPMKASFRRQFQRIVPPLVRGLTARCPRSLAHPALGSADTVSLDRGASGTGIGFIGGHTCHAIPAAMRRRFAFPPEVLRDSAVIGRHAPACAPFRDLSGLFAATPISIRRLIVRIRGAADDVPGLFPGDVARSGSCSPFASSPGACPGTGPPPRFLVPCASHPAEQCAEQTHSGQDTVRVGDAQR